MQLTLPKALTIENLEALRTALNEKDDFVLIKGYSDPLFCGGADLVFLLEAKKSELKKFFFLLVDVLLTLYGYKGIVVCNVSGAAVGGGVGFVAVADIVTGSETFRWKLSEVQLGFGPYVISPFLNARIGYSSLIEIAISGRWVSFQESVSMGLVSDTNIDVSQLHNPWLRLAKKLFKPKIEKRIFRDLVANVVVAVCSRAVREKVSQLASERRKS
ncbi:MAG: enoyl-CoA hydratase-related protein [Deltaproteobacteria bacterium]|nr:enoyl-CoA hydratase-related protein [Deltaproteobacteria bacterium]